MKVLGLASLVAVTLSVPAYANESVNLNGNVEATLKKHVGKDGWAFYEVDMEPNNGMPCCYQKSGKQGCDLSKRKNYWGATHDSKSDDSDTLRVFYQWDGKAVSDLFIAGSECPVAVGNSVLTEIAQVSSKQSAQFLNQLVNNARRDRINSSALAALANHKGSDAQNALQKLTRSNNQETRENAIFWMGQARNAAGFEFLDELLSDSSVDGNSKERAIFALSVNSDKRADQKLLSIAEKHGNQELRGKALFWLAQDSNKEALPLIKKILKQKNNEDLIDKTVFSLAEFKSQEARDLLKDIALQHQSSYVRSKAIFWLSQDRDEEAYDVLMKIVQEENTSREIKESTVFAISQLNDKLAAKGLIELIQNSNDRTIKKKAIFWLGQMDSDEATSYIESLLVAAD